MHNNWQKCFRSQIGQNNRNNHPNSKTYKTPKILLFPKTDGAEQPLGLLDPDTQSKGYKDKRHVDVRDPIHHQKDTPKCKEWHFESLFAKVQVLEPDIPFPA